MSADALETACRKCIRIEVSDTRRLARLLDSENLEYTIISQTEAEIYGHIDITDMALKLSKENVKIITMNEKDESLESYYIRLVGGDIHE